jgi:CelD/BcsL family acetyltransferase involved in cellulose biosynthesis
MIRIRVSADPGECRRIWRKLWPRTCFFDLWPVREIFADFFARTPFFVIAEENNEPVGMLALSFLEELRQYVFFPGEIWQGKTWIEQNKIPVRHRALRDELLAAVPAEAFLRYLTPESEPIDGSSFVMDEENFRFYPRLHGYSFDMYMQEFSNKSRKNLSRELEKLTACGVTYRYDQPADIDHLLELNLAAYGDLSYFADQRFQGAFVRLCTWLAEQKMLRITALLLGDRIAAVDAGAVWNGQYTVLAGGTDGDFPGVAKLINFHHLTWACAERLDVVDFLCGDFSWKRRFHLQPSPLYKLHLPGSLTADISSAVNERSASC